MTPAFEGREVVVRLEGRDWSFTLPDQDQIDFVNDDDVMLSVPHASTTFHLVGISTADSQEAVVVIGKAVARTGPSGVGDYVPEPTGYPIPEIHEEFARLEARCRDAGGDSQDLPSWAGRKGHEDHLRSTRATIQPIVTNPSAPGLQKPNNPDGRELLLGQKR
jgi:hypothetical protein